MTVHAEIAGRELRFEMQMHGIHLGAKCAWRSGLYRRAWLVG
jgi:hypothetical protein